MGTRCLTVFHDDDGSEVAVLYRQFDGYPEGHGAELRDWFADKGMTNGLKGPNDFNGMGCCAALTVAHFKTEPGGFYLYAAGTRDVGEEYVYHVHPNTDGTPGVRVEVEEDGKRRPLAEALKAAEADAESD